MRRFAACLLLLAGLAFAPLVLAEDNEIDNPILPNYPEVGPGMALQFPADHGAHRDFRTEWWYITGWLDSATGPLGFQITFFRTRPLVDQRNPSAFAAKQIIFAHAALSDPVVGALLHDQRAARAGFGLAEASASDTDLILRDWSLKRDADGSFHAKVPAKGFSLDLTFSPAQPALLQGDSGYSRKGPLATEASYYYSLPHLEISGAIRRDGRDMQVKGSAWLDHEWSSTLLDPRAVGWDWVGLNLDDGGALMAFQIRDAAGNALWAGGTLRRADGTSVRFAPGDVRFATQRNWRSARTGTTYPVERTLSVRLPEGEHQWHIKPLFDDQELDGGAAGGPVYWEGAATVEGGRGYLELTGYGRALKM